MLRLRFQLGNLYEIPRRLQAFADKLRDWGPFFRDEFIPEYMRDVQSNFDSQGGMVGGWAPLSPAYATWKARHFPGTRILERTLQLRQSLDPRGNPNLTTTINRRQAFVGTRLHYAAHVNTKRRFLLRPRDLKMNKYAGLRDDWLRRMIRESKLG